MAVGSETLVARQPVFDRGLTVVGYELLYRAARDARSADVDDGDAATATVVAGLVGGVELARLTGGVPAFVNVSGSFIREDAILLLDPAKVVLELLSTLQDDDADLSAIERAILRDSALALRLLRYVNSAYVGLPRSISSIREAIVMLGSDTIRRWATILALARVPGKPTELLRVGLVRARMCELVRTTPGGGGFLAGLLSVLPGLFDLPVGAVVAQMPLLHDDVVRAIRDGALGAVVAYEEGRFDDAEALAPGAVDLARAYRDAAACADAVLGVASDATTGSSGAAR